MLFTKTISRVLAVFTICSTFYVQCAASAEESFSTNNKVVQASHTKAAPANKLAINAAACSACGSPTWVNKEAQLSLKKGKHQSLLTDSLWGNLILELAYERDPELNKLAKKVNLMNIGTTLAVTGIAAGTLAQGIVALQVLNPPDGVPDSYAPLTMGVVLSGLTMLALGARTVMGHQLAKHITERQLQIKNGVEALLAHLEYSKTECKVAQIQLKELVGERASKEWIQIWSSTHTLVATKPQQISLNTEEKSKLVGLLSPLPTKEVSQ